MMLVMAMVMRTVIINIMNINHIVKNKSTRMKYRQTQHAYYHHHHHHRDYHHQPEHAVLGPISPSHMHRNEGEDAVGGGQEEEEAAGGGGGNRRGRNETRSGTVENGMHVQLWLG